MASNELASIISETYLSNSGVGSLRPFTNCGNCVTYLVVLYFMYLPSLQFLVLHTYEELLRNSTILLGFHYNYENQK